MNSKVNFEVKLQWNTIEPENNEILIHAPAWMNLENVMLSKRSQSQKATYLILSSYFLNEFSTVEHSRET